MKRNLGIRLSISLFFVRIGAWFGSEYVRAWLLQMADAAKGVSGEIARGRTGGVVTMRWYVDQQGLTAATQIENAMTETARAVRLQLESAHPPE